MNTNAPTSPALVKKIEKGIMKEAKNEDHNLKHAVKDLSQTEKAEVKAQKAATKAEQQLIKLEKYEQSTLNALHKATHDHDIAATKMHSAETDLEMKRRQHQKLQRGVDDKKHQVENAMKVNEEHSKARENKLAELHGSPSKNVAQGKEGAPPEHRRVPGGYEGANPQVAQGHEGKGVPTQATQSVDPKPRQ